MSAAYLLVGLGVHAVGGQASTSLRYTCEKPFQVVRLYVPAVVSPDFLVTAIKLARRDGSAEDALLGEAVPASLFESVVELPEEYLERFKSGGPGAPQYPWPLRLSRASEGDEVVVSVTNLNIATRNFLGALVVVPLGPEEAKT